MKCTLAPEGHKCLKDQGHLGYCDLEKDFTRDKIVNALLAAIKDKKTISINKWIRPSELPNEFWEEVFVMSKPYDSGKRSDFAVIRMIKKEAGSVKIYNEMANSWWKIDDKCYRVMLIKRPEQDWSAFE